MNTLLNVSPRTSSGKSAGETPDEICIKLASQIEKRIGKVFVYKKSENPNSLEIFRNQEIDRFNALIKTVKTTLVDLQKAIKVKFYKIF